MSNTDDPFAELEDDPFAQLEQKAATPEKSLGRTIYDYSQAPAMALGGMGGGLAGSAVGPMGTFAGGTLGTMGSAESRRLIGTALGY